MENGKLLFYNKCIRENHVIGIHCLGYWLSNAISHYLEWTSYMLRSYDIDCVQEKILSYKRLPDLICFVSHVIFD
jgi:hypothetical protein